MRIKSEEGYQKVIKELETYLQKIISSLTPYEEARLELLFKAAERWNKTLCNEIR